MNLDPTSRSRAARDLRAALAEWLSGFAWTHALTLAVNSAPAAAGPCLRLDPTTGRARHVSPGIARSSSGNAPYWPISGPHLREMVKRLHARVDRQLLGSRFNRLPPERRSRFIGFVEAMNVHPHVHFLWKAPAERVGHFEILFNNAARDTPWRDIAPFGSHCLERFHDVSGWASYCLKRQMSDDAWDTMIISDDFCPTK